FEALLSDRQVQDALLGADRAVALADDRLSQIDLDPKPDPAAMAAALIGLQHRLMPPLMPSPPLWRGASQLPNPNETRRRQQRHERVGLTAIGTVERARDQHDETAAEPRR